MRPTDCHVPSEAGAGELSSSRVIAQDLGLGDEAGFLDHGVHTQPAVQGGLRCRGSRGWKK